MRRWPALRGGGASVETRQLRSLFRPLTARPVQAGEAGSYLHIQLIMGSERSERHPLLSGERAHLPDRHGAAHLDAEAGVRAELRGQRGRTHTELRADGEEKPDPVRAAHGNLTAPSRTAASATRRATGGTRGMRMKYRSMTTSDGAALRGRGATEEDSALKGARRYTVPVRPISRVSRAYRFSGLSAARC